MDPPPPPKRVGLHGAEALRWVWVLAPRKETNQSQWQSALRRLRTMMGIGDLEPPCPVLHSHIGGGEHPPNFFASYEDFVQSMLALAWEGCQGAEAAPVRRGTTVPLSPTKKFSPVGWNKQCKQFISKKPHQCVQLEVNRHLHSTKVANRPPADPRAFAIGEELFFFSVGLSLGPAPRQQGNVATIHTNPLLV